MLAIAWSLASQRCLHDIAPLGDCMAIGPAERTGEAGREELDERHHRARPQGRGMTPKPSIIAIYHLQITKIPKQFCITHIMSCMCLQHLLCRAPDESLPPLSFPRERGRTAGHLVRTQHGITASAGQRLGDVEVRSYLRDQAGSRSLIFDLSIAHDR